jgi:hypothetical protein
MVNLLAAIRLSRSRMMTVKVCLSTTNTLRRDGFLAVMRQLRLEEDAEQRRRPGLPTKPVSVTYQNMHTLRGGTSPAWQRLLEEEDA